LGEEGAAVLLKGGQLHSEECPDLLVEFGAVFRFSAARNPVARSHVTRCALSAAIAAGLVRGGSHPVAVKSAKNHLGERHSRSCSFTPAGREIVHALSRGTTFPKNEA
jgi:hydroxymethylpyrimidine/phosphomethylpyrimidine kinase